MKTNQVKEFAIRSASGLVYAAIMIGSVTLHPLGFLAVFAFVLIKGMWEFYALISAKEHKPMVIPGITAGILLLSALFFKEYLDLDSRILIIPGLAVVTLFSIPMFIPRIHVIYSLSLTLTGLLYVAVPVSLFTGLAYNPYHQGFDYQVVLFLFAVIWLNDTGAYITGGLFGKHKMFPNISPKKSWEGFAGGLILSIGVALLIRPWLPDLPANLVWIYALAIVLAGTLGDLAESSMKRAAGVKDSGRFMPGHGGLLDRFDSLLFAAPVFYCLIHLFTA